MRVHKILSCFKKLELDITKVLGFLPVQFVLISYPRDNLLIVFVLQLLQLVRFGHRPLRYFILLTVPAPAHRVPKSDGGLLVVKLRRVVQLETVSRFPCVVCAPLS